MSAAYRPGQLWQGRDGDLLFVVLPGHDIEFVTNHGTRIGLTMVEKVYAPLTMLRDVDGPAAESPDDTTGTRSDIVRGLRDLATFLDANPAVPVGRSTDVVLQYSIAAYEPWRSDFPKACIEVERVSCLINRAATEEGSEPGRGRRRAVRRFGPVSYVALAIEKADDLNSDGPATDGSPF